MTSRALRALRRKAQARSRGQSIGFLYHPSDSGRPHDFELTEGSMKKLKINHGDLVVVRLARSPRGDTYQRILDCIYDLIHLTGRRATAVVMPADFDFELIPHDTAVELLRELTKKKKKGGS